MHNKHTMRKGNRFVDLKNNGRLFPLWMMANFKEYKLPEVFQDPDVDPCNKTKTKLELHKYQLFFSKYLDFNGQYTNILIYHGLGSGKTVSAINVYNMLYNYTPAWNVFILIKATLYDEPWLKDLETWLQKDEEKYRRDNIIFISYDSPIADKQFLEAIKNSDASKKNIYIIDEAHNFISNVYSNITTKQGRRAQTIYDYILQDQKENEGVRVILLSGTPAINKPFEIGLLFNLLRPGIFPKNETEFNQLYVTSSAFPKIHPAHRNSFQRRILGLVSYYIGANPEVFASKTFNQIDVVMSQYQEDIYKYFEEIEDAMARKKRSRTSGSETYRSYTRQACNFTFPLMAQGMAGETRPRPSKFKLTEKDAQAIDKGKSEKLGSDKAEASKQYIRMIQSFVDTFRTYLDKKKNADDRSGFTLENDLKSIGTDFTDVASKIKSSLLEAMYTCSAKYIHMILRILKSPGPVLVYSNYVYMEGLQLFGLYLNYFGFDIYGKTNGSGLSWMEYHGAIEKTERKKNLVIFNDSANVRGDIVKIMLVSPAGTEGLSLNNVKQVHIMEPYWHEVRITQMIGRAVRQCSHRDLPKSERHVEIFRYKSVRKTGKETTDQFIENVAKSKDGLIQSFLDTIKEAAVDCQLYKNENMLLGEYKCFQFNEPSYFDNQIGPAYKTDIYDDLNMNNGSNSLFSTTKRIKVIKIKAVKRLTPDNKYSPSENYWYNPETGVVYDSDLHFPIGKVKSDDGIADKLETGEYIIDKVIPIPMIVS